MTYEQVQLVSQLVSMALFMAMLAGAFIYAFRTKNRAKFERASRAPLDNDDTPKKRRTGA